MENLIFMPGIWLRERVHFQPARYAVFLPNTGCVRLMGFQPK